MCKWTNLHICFLNNDFCWPQAMQVWCFLLTFNESAKWGRVLAHKRWDRVTEVVGSSISAITMKYSMIKDWNLSINKIKTIWIVHEEKQKWTRNVYGKQAENFGSQRMYVCLCVFMWMCVGCVFVCVCALSVLFGH